MSVTFATVEAALLADVKPAVLHVFIGDVYTDVIEAHTSHGTEQPVATASLLLELPAPSWVDYNVPVRIEAGYPGATAVIFDGVIPHTDGAFDDSGGWLTVNAVGWASRLQGNDYADLTFVVSNTPQKMFQTLCARRQVPHYLSDATTYVDGVTDLVLTGVTGVTGGNVVMSGSTDPLTFLNRIGKLFGYRVFDTPSGVVRQMRVSGIPNGQAVYGFTEGYNAFRLEAVGDLTEMTTYWEVLGATYTDSNGAQVSIRSIPDAVPYSPLLDPPGYRHQQLSDALLVSTTLADDSRNVQEIDYGAPTETVAWDTEGIPDLQPGDTVTMVSPTIGAVRPLWVTAVKHDFTDSGFLSSWTGWSGNGQALPAGSDTVSQHIGSQQVYHVGDETVAWYKQPAPDGTQVDIPFTVDDHYTSLTITGYAHGVNSMFLGGANTNITASTFEIYQGGTDSSHKVGSGQMPVMDEYYDQHYDYASSLSHWQAFTLPITGSLKAGSAILRLIAGSDSSSGTLDDYEVDGPTLTLITGGVSQPRGL